MLYSAGKIVNWLRVKNNAYMHLNPNEDEITQMRAMKLLYYIQAASLAVEGKRLFDNDIVNTKYGPSIKEVHEKYRNQRGIVGKITQEDIDDYKELQQDQQAADILNSIYDIYGHSSAYDLMQQIQREGLWGKEGTVISDQSIENSYQKVFFTQ